MSPHKQKSMVGHAGVGLGTSVNSNFHRLLYRYAPRHADAGKPPKRLDSKPASIPLNGYFKNENRFMKLERSDPEHYATLLAGAEAE